MSGRLRIGSRGSKLALWQSHYVADLLQSAHGEDIDVVVEIFSTQGDRNQAQPLPEIGGKGLFTEELEQALRDGSIDVAVHSLKDLPTDSPDGLAVLALPKRADPRDALVVRIDHLEALASRIAAEPESFDPSNPLGALPAGAVVGTSSLRRSAQLRALRPDVELRDVRGNVDTRLRKLDEGQYDALLLACAGLDRLGLDDRIHRRLDSPWLGAAGQGAVAVQGRLGDVATGTWLQAIDHRPTRLEVSAERTLLHVLQGGCSLPLGVRAQREGDRLRMDAVLMTPDAALQARARRDGEATRVGAERLGRSLARDLMDRGGGRILDQVRGEG